MMPADLGKRAVEASWRAEGEVGEGVVRLMGGGGNERGDLSEKDYAYMSYIPYISCICPIYN